MKKKIQLVPSGITIVDTSWGGFYQGGTYLLFGPKKSGRTLLSLQFACHAVKQNEVCLYFTTMRPKDLMIQAASIDFDLQKYMNKNQMIVIRVAPPAHSEMAEEKDNLLVEYLHDIVSLIDQYQPGKIIFDELTTFVSFEDIELLEDTFLSTTERIEEKGVTSLLVLGEPATPASQSIADTLISGSTGYIFLQKSENGVEHSTEGKITITPNIGHTEGQFSSSYSIEPYKGVVVNSGESRKGSKRTGGDNGESEKYISAHLLDLTEPTLTFSNIYSIDDFKLLLNNQIAMYKSTGKPFKLISIMIDEEALKSGMITMNQLANAVRLSSERRDKLCISSNKVIVLFAREDSKNINSLLAILKTNLPSQNIDYLERMMRYISVYLLSVNQEFQNADAMLDELLDNQLQNNDTI